MAHEHKVSESPIGEAVDHGASGPTNVSNAPLVPIRCALCDSDQVNQPARLFLCLHSACESCIERESAEKGGVIVCRLCGYQTILGNENSIQALPRDRRLDPSSIPSAPVCDNCKEHTIELFCSRCDSSLCSGCSRMIHSAPLFASHRTVPIKKDTIYEKRQQFDPCATHATQLMDHFCIRCAAPTCSLCLLSGEHKGHDFCTLKQQRDALEAMLGEQLVRTHTRASDLRSDEVAVRDTIAQLEKNYDETVQKVKIHFAEIQNTLSQRQHQLLNEALQLRNRKLQKLQEQADTLGDTILIIKDAVNTSTLLLKQSNDPQLVECAGFIDSRLKNIASDEATPVREPVEDATLGCVLHDEISSTIVNYGMVYEGQPKRYMLTQQQATALTDAVAAAAGGRVTQETAPKTSKSVSPAPTGDAHAASADAAAGVDGQGEENNGPACVIL